VTTALQILLAMGLAAALINLAVDHHRTTHEFDDIAELTRQQAARAAMRRTTDTTRSTTP
jgi:hypothetical protein